jgi:hypothetical protein
MKRPENTEYSEWYAGYVGSVGETDIVSVLEKQIDEIKDTFAEISEEKGLYRYAEGKWTIKEVLGHLIDGERIFAYRTFRISRRDETPLAGFDQDPYIENSNSNERTISDLVEELVLLRQANMFVFRNLKETDWDIFGTASNAKVSVRALAYIIAGHIRHHLKILQERYLQ